MATPENLNVAAIGQIQAGALAAGNLALIVPALLGGKPVGYQPLAGLDPDGNVQPIQPAFLFHYEGENKAVLESDITDHYIESNTPIEDMIALHPIIISVHGFIGELNDVPEAGLVGSIQSAAKTVVNKLQGVSAYAPVLSTTATNVYNQASQAYSTANSLYNSGSAIVDSIKGNTPTQGKQAQAYLQFKKWWLARQLFNVQTPWEIAHNYAIKTLTVTQTDKTNTVTEFMVEFKQMQFTSVNTVLSNTNIPSIPNSKNALTPAALGSSAGLSTLPSTPSLGAGDTATLGSPLYNASNPTLSVAAPTSGTTPSVLPGTLSAGTFSL